MNEKNHLSMNLTIKPPVFFAFTALVISLGLSSCIHPEHSGVITTTPVSTTTPQPIKAHQPTELPIPTETIDFITLPFFTLAPLLPTPTPIPGLGTSLETYKEVLKTAGFAFRTTSIGERETLANGIIATVNFSGYPEDLAFAQLHIQVGIQDRGIDKAIRGFLYPVFSNPTDFNNSYNWLMENIESIKSRRGLKTQIKDIHISCESDGMGNGGYIITLASN